MYRDILKRLDKFSVKKGTLSPKICPIYIGIFHLVLNDVKLILNHRLIRSIYWIYNLIRAFFFRNLNVYLRKTCTIVLFKVLPIWSYDIFPYFWQFVDSIPKELRQLGGQEWIKPVFDTLFWCEPYSSVGVLHRPEQNLVRRGKVWAIRRVGWNFPSTVFQIVLNRNSDMGPSVVMMENYCVNFAP